MPSISKEPPGRAEVEANAEQLQCTLTIKRERARIRIDVRMLNYYNND